MKKGKLKILVKSPNRVNILGSGVDGIEGDFWTLSVACEPFSSVELECGENFFIQTEKGGYKELVFDGGQNKEGLEYMLFSCIQGLLKYFPIFKEKLSTPFRLKINPSVPRQSGLGGSSSIINALIHSLLRFYKLTFADLSGEIRENLAKSPYIFTEKALIAEIATRIERDFMNVMCGYADRYIIEFGGIALLGYRGKLYHKEIGEEPPATYEPILCPELPIVIIFSGEEHSSGDVHSYLRKIYMEHLSKFNEDSSYILKNMRLIGEAALEGKKLIEKRSWKELGLLILENQKLIEEVLYKSGIKEGPGKANTMLLEEGAKAGALGGKLTGAGGGGSVFFLLEPDYIDQFFSKMEGICLSANLKNFWINSLKIASGPIINRFYPDITLQ